MDWHRIARTVKEVGDRNDGGLAFWDFLEFVTNQRGPLYIIMYAYIWDKATNVNLDSPDIDTLQVRRILDSIKSMILPLPKCRGTVLVELANELKLLKEEVASTKEGVIRHTMNNDQEYLRGTQQPSFTELTQDEHSVTKLGHPPGMVTNKKRSVSSSTGSGSQRSSLNLKRDYSIKSDVGPQHGARQGQQGPCEGDEHTGFYSKHKQRTTSAVERLLRRTSYAGESFPSGGAEGQKDGAVSCHSEPRLYRKSTYMLRRRELGRQLSSEANCEEVCDTEPTDRLLQEDEQGPPRLHRQKAQSRKAFQMRKSRKGTNVQISHIKIEEPPHHSSKSSKEEEFTDKLHELCVSSMTDPNNEIACGIQVKGLMHEALQPSVMSEFVGICPMPTVMEASSPGDQSTSPLDSQIQESFHTWRTASGTEKTFSLPPKIPEDSSSTDSTVPANPNLQKASSGESLSSGEKMALLKRRELSRSELSLADNTRRKEEDTFL